MTKGKKAKGKKAASKNAVPKKVAGVKVPKEVRKSKSLSTLLTSGLGREILADALIAAAGAAAAALTRNRSVREAGQSVAEAGKSVADVGANAASATGDAVQTAAGAVANVVSDAARNFLPASLVGEGEEKTPKARYLHRSADHSSTKRSKAAGGRKGKKGE